MAADDWLELTDGSFKGFAFHVAQPTFGLDSHGAEEVSVSGGRRLHKIERPFVDGQRVLDLGKKGDEITVVLVFFGPTYLDRFEEFKEVLNEGTSGELILPDRRESLKASFSTINESSRAGQASSKQVTVTWIQDEVSAQEVAVGAAEGLIPQGLLDAIDGVLGAVSSAQAVIRNNPILATIRQVDQVLAAVTSAVVSSLAIALAVRTRILTSVANIEEAFDTIVSSAKQIGTLFGGQEEPTGFESGRVDSQTGQPIEDAAPDEVTEPEDPLVRPDPVPDQVIEVVSLQTTEGLQKFQSDTLALLCSMDEALSGDTDGRTDDVSDALTDVKNTVRDMIQAAIPAPVRLVVTPFELSLSEIMFQNDVDLNTMDSVLERNSFIDDIHVVPQGSVVSL